MQLYQIYYILPFLVALFAQLIKLLIDYVRGDGHIKRSSLRISGGMPSAHTTLTSSLLTMVFILEGTWSELTMIVSVYALLIRYDAANVRYESGKHAQYINSLKQEMVDIMMKKDKKKTLSNSFFSFDLLKERLGHTPNEIIVGVLFGITVTIGLTVLIDTYLVTLPPVS